MWIRKGAHPPAGRPVLRGSVGARRSWPSLPHRAAGPQGTPARGGVHSLRKQVPGRRLSLVRRGGSNCRPRKQTEFEGLNDGTTGCRVMSSHRLRKPALRVGAPCGHFCPATLGQLPMPPFQSPFVCGSWERPLQRGQGAGLRDPPLWSPGSPSWVTADRSVPPRLRQLRFCPGV